MGNDEYFKDKYCLVTGANSGIGYAISEELLKKGAIVFMAGRNAESLESAAKTLDSYAEQIRILLVDVTKQPEVDKAIQDTVAAEGRIDFLFNNAGIGGTMPTVDATLEHWRSIIDVNLWSVIYGINAALPFMRLQGGGHIVNTASLAGLIPFPFQSLYCATKYAVVGMSESMRYEFAEEGIHFSVTCPAAVVSRIWKKPILGPVHEEIKAPEDAIPAEEAAQIILQGVADKKGIIVVPEQPCGWLWHEYCNLSEAAEDFLLKMAHDRRIEWSKRQRS
ncbi:MULTISPECIES: SDR family NAD(P)-dependent oxidoreductase [Methanosarcina]|uniref:Short-chain dehydrogenase/reductase SDR n=2 Tax=Methanosarcina barkeri TaxID=2208 RepID=A0A0E3QSE8_METBA|nr:MULTISPECIES: SDR family oxidoreductase [Methanosarcina]AKB53399.1 short-chain dehydrogenase/reductase SDR [Methanosarcina barkeri MS]AKB58498.1 short-chain dehydrogenase/reductase SDR [Methanosarcina barkeri 227]